MTEDITLSCRCGKLKARLSDVGPQTGTHILCHCADCRATYNHLGVTDYGDESIDLFQTSPDKLTILQGGENLALMRLSKRGLLRWYAKCCNTPMFNTLASPKLPFVAVHAATMDSPEAIGPVKGEGFVRNRNGKVGHKGGLRIAAGVIGRMAKARLSGRWRDTPFFDASTLEPVVPAEILSREERRKATPH